MDALRIHADAGLPVGANNVSIATWLSTSDERPSVLAHPRAITRFGEPARIEVIGADGARTSAIAPVARSSTGAGGRAGVR